MGLCPWPQEGLSSERLSLASDFFCVLGLGFFLCPWPRALCPRLHLWYLVTSNNQTAVISKASRASVGTEGYSDDTSAPVMGFKILRTGSLLYRTY